MHADYDKVYNSIVLCVSNVITNCVANEITYNSIQFTLYKKRYKIPALNNA